MTPMEQRPVTTLKGVGPRKADVLRRLGIETVYDLLTYFPRTYEDRTQVVSIRDIPDDGAPVCIQGTPVSPMHHTRLRGSLTLSRTTLADDTGRLTLCFFNQQYTADSLRPGETYVFYGRVEQKKQRQKTLYNPLFERASDVPLQTRRLVPVYRLTAGISGAVLSQLVSQALALAKDDLQDPLPDALRTVHHLPHRAYALHVIHFPSSMEELALARRRLVWEEFLLFSLGLGLLRARQTRGTGHPLAAISLEPFYNALPFTLTRAQQRAIEEIVVDCATSRPMNRLLQGDVGSGKTMVAAAALYLAAKNGVQAALMAPTELLARQHANTLIPLLEACGVRAALLTGTGSMGAKERRAVLQDLEAGALDVLIGTHALLSDQVAFPCLGLVITDEQHRFGVHQRAVLAGKGMAPHTLVLSATPIPRTLALILYGDLDLSVLDELPPQRKPVDTFLVGEDKRARLYRFVRKLVTEGRQAYIVCPAIDEIDENGSLSPLKTVTAYTETLKREVFPDLRVACVHGRMPPKEKDAVMGAFAAGKLDVLVSTTVIEVGVDVPNAALMIVENAERFGLSQLHQLRGRVGRGPHQSYCVLLSSHPAGDTLERLNALCKTRDGFQIAEADLKLRGPGDFFGLRQHGLPQLRIGDFSEDMALLKSAQSAASQLLTDDPELSHPKNAPLRAQVETLLDRADGGWN